MKCVSDLCINTQSMGKLNEKVTVTNNSKTENRENCSIYCMSSSEKYNV